MTGGHVEEAGLFINDIVMNTSRVSINDNMIYPGIINELGGIGQEKVRVLFESTGPREFKYHGSSLNQVQYRLRAVDNCSGLLDICLPC